MEQMCLFADRLSSDEMKANQLRLYFSALAYTLMEALRRLALKGTEWAQSPGRYHPPETAQNRCPRAAQRAPRALGNSSTFPWRDLTQAFYALRC